MPHTTLTRRQGGLLVKVILIGLIVQVAVVVYVFVTTHNTSREIVDSSRTACERSKQDRQDNASGWRAAEIARLHTRSKHISFEQVRKLIKRKSKPSDSSDLITARKYNKIATGLEARSRISCTAAFPKRGWLP